jgi:serine/threonine protein kinase
MGVVLMKMIFNYIISTVNDVCDQQGSSSSSDDDEKENTGLIKIISDYTSVFGIPEGESWKKLVNDYQEKLKKDEKKDEEKEKIDESSVFSILRTFLLPTESLDRSYAFQVWLKLNLGKSYSAALKLFGQADLDDLISIINSCLSLDPSKRAHSSSILQHPLFIRHGLCNSSTACGGFTSTSVPIAVDKEKEDSKEEKKEEKKQPVQQKEERREEKKRSVQQAQHFDFIKSNFLMMQELIGCHQNTIEIATDIAKRLLKNTEITRMLENGKLSPRTLGITILILAIKYNQGEIIYKVNLMSALVISILKLSEKDLRKVKLCEINLFNLIFNAGAGSSPQSYSPQMISEECRKKLNPFLNYFF